MINLGEIFEFPLLSEVILDLRFPTRLDMANYMGEFQTNIEEIFPIADDAYVQNIKLSKIGETETLTDKVWEFINPDDETSCRIFKNKFALVSKKYKFWEKEGEKGFKDIIKETYNHFFSLVPIKKFTRVGLRYINKDEVKSETSEWFKKYFIPLFNLDKYEIKSLDQNYVRLKIRKTESIELTIQSTFIIENSVKYYILDFDAFSKDIEKGNTLEKIDALHQIILKEFHSLITDECRKKMRGL